MDDSGILGLRREVLEKIHERYKTAVRLRGFELHPEKGHGSEKETISLGFRTDGVQATLEPRPDKWVKVAAALRLLRKRGRVPASQLECVLGHVVCLALLRRPYLSSVESMERPIVGPTDSFERLGSA